MQSSFEKHQLLAIPLQMLNDCPSLLLACSLTHTLRLTSLFTHTHKIAIKRHPLAHSLTLYSYTAIKRHLFAFCLFIYTSVYPAHTHTHSPFELLMYFFLVCQANLLAQVKKNNSNNNSWTVIHLPKHLQNKNNLNFHYRQSTCRSHSLTLSLVRSLCTLSCPFTSHTFGHLNDTHSFIKCVE